MRSLCTAFPIWTAAAGRTALLSHGSVRIDHDGSDEKKDQDIVDVHRLETQGRADQTDDDGSEIAQTALP